MLGEKHTAKLRERIRPGIVERPEQALPVVDRQPHDQRLSLECVSEHGRGRLVDEAGEHHRIEGIA